MPYLDKAGLSCFWQKIKTALSGKQDILTGGAAGQFLSKASDADGDTQWVDPPAGGDSAGEGSTGEVYSTEETVIGTWIDGSPLYRKVMEGVTPSSSGESKAILALKPNKPDASVTTVPIRVYGALQGGVSVPNVFEGSSIGLSRESNSIFCQVSGTRYLSKQIFVIYEYAKVDKNTIPDEE